jgi:hypothetical protein
MSIDDDVATIKTAADGGDRHAQRALQALTRVAAEAAVPEGERGIAEARRRYGPLPGDAA